MMQAFDESAYAEALRRWDAVAKPLHSLGAFEGMIARIAAIQGTADVQLTPRCVLTFCGDHGVVAQGVSQSSSDVTAKVARAIVRGDSNINLMAASAQAEVFAVDMGMAEAGTGAIDCRLGAGTADMTQGPAMTRQQAEAGLRAGRDLVGRMKRQGYRMIAVGEMGIGNTTAAAALACALLQGDIDRWTGTGAGLSPKGLERKRRAVRRALEINRPTDALDALAKVGGFEIAGMAGAFLGGAEHGVVMVIDGVISAVAALIAERIQPGTRQFLLPSHASREPAAHAILEALDLRPVIDADLALGEGTGAVMLFPLLDMAHRVYSGSHTFQSLEMAAYEPQEDKP